MKQSLGFKLSQQLALTPQLQQSIRLLQLSTLELELEVEQALAANPLLEADEETPDAPPDVTEDTGEYLSSVPTLQTVEVEAGVQVERSEELYGETDFSGDHSAAELAQWGQEDSVGSGPSSDVPEDEEEGFAADRENAKLRPLRTHLQEQLGGRTLSPASRAAALVIIESLDENGLLADSLEDLVAWLAPDSTDLEAVEQTMAELRCALALVQSFDPPGVAAIDVAQCMLLQLKRLPLTGINRLARLICVECFALLGKRDLKRIAKQLDEDEEDVRRANALIAQLCPRPAAGFSNEREREILPDVIVIREGRQFKAVLNQDVMPKLRINALYASILKQRGHSSMEGLQTQLQEARWFIKNIQQRFDTILRVSQAIIERQRNFFLTGAQGMRPLVLKEIADTLGLHESTISRVTTAKYMRTAHGTFELKYFFTSGVATDTGGSASSTAVKSLIADLVAAEDDTKPLNDSELTERLAERGIVIARRTVAKYREALRIAPANLRRAA